ncbi:MAG TPA: homoserine acetyltransferase, partial [Burkholderiales bacterium]|nr:homoserine acetyltransferase [Burkholderiales bacterium]
KKFFALPQYTTAAGKTIKNVRVGYETYGKLNAAGDNAVFVAHFFSGTSHAAGRYKADEKAAGYWDAIIGPGKAIDTDKYFVVSADTLANLNVKSPLVGTTGPATVNPDTGKPYGSSFPVVSMKDSVRVHKALVDSLGIKKLQAVAGASGGSIQAMEWGVEYPELVERVIHVIGPGLEIQPYTLGMIDVWAMPIRLDPNWKGGDYYGGTEPSEGLAQALKVVTLHRAFRLGRKAARL